jgi:hypothetical protein
MRVLFFRRDIYLITLEFQLSKGLYFKAKKDFIRFKIIYLSIVLDT